jgi:hypothetical protein
VTPLQIKALFILGIVFIGYSFIIERGLFGNEEIHVVTVVDKYREIYYDTGWVQWFVDDNRNEYNVDKEMYDMIQPGHTYRIKTGKQDILNRRWYAYYAEDLGAGNRSYIVTGKQSRFGSQWHAQFTEDLKEEDKP